MVICNTTIAVEDSVQEEWIEWMNGQYLALLRDTGYFSQVLLMRILADSSEQEGSSFALILLCKDMATFLEFERKFSTKLDNLHNTKYRGRFGSFRTLLEEV